MNIKRLMIFGIMSAILAGCANSSNTTTQAEEETQSAGAQNDASGSNLGFPKDAIVTWAVPGKTGGGSDLATRYYSEAMTEVLGIKNTVTNYDSNTIAHQTVANAKPDEGVIMLATAALNIQYITGNADVNPKEDLTLIAAMQDNGFSALCAPADAPYDNFSEMIDYALAHPGELNAGQPNSGNNTFQFGLIEKETGADFNAVEASSESDRLTNLAGGFIDLGFANIKNAQEYEKAGKLKVIATIAGEGRKVAEFDNTLPENYKTMQEQGFEKCYWNVSHYVYGPKGMDEGQVENINAAMKQLYENSKCREGIESLGQIPEWHDVKESKEIRDKEYDKEVEVAEFLGIMNK